MKRVTLLLLMALMASAAGTKTTFLYWFSASQKQVLVEVESLDDNATTKAPYVPLYVTVNGKKLEYTECQPQSVGKPYGRYNDYKLVATTDSGPCGPGKGQW